jgi:catechol 2,3-dioxygenase-like lactoylglutathione lyase family enzyme
MKEKIIYGIQQIGVGVSDANAAFNWYGKIIGADLLIFDDDNTATFMHPYMGGNPHKKRAILSANIQGGGGFELWQYLDRTPAHPAEEISLGDLGIYAIKIKTKNINSAYESIKSKGAKILCEIQIDPAGTSFFFIEDPYGNKLQIISYDNFFTDNANYSTGGIMGCVIGVSNIEEARRLYSSVLGYNKVIYDTTEKFSDLSFLKGGKNEFRRVLLACDQVKTGGMSPLFGTSQIELVEVKNFEPKKIFQNRFWGDIGFIHLCFDIRGMESLRAECDKNGFPFTIDSLGAFKMGEASGHWCYTEDPDGTLIEFVETFRLPIIKRFNWNLDLQKRDPHKSLPKWVLRSLSLNRKKVK